MFSGITNPATPRTCRPTAALPCFTASIASEFRTPETALTRRRLFQFKGLYFRCRTKPFPEEGERTPLTLDLVNTSCWTPGDNICDKQNSSSMQGVSTKFTVLYKRYHIFKAQSILLQDEEDWRKGENRSIQEPYRYHTDSCIAPNTYSSVTISSGK